VFTDVGGTPADGVNELSQAVARYVAGGATYQAGGTANAITLSSQGARQGVSIMPEGATFRFIATATNTGSATVNVQGIGAKTIRKNGFASNLEAGDIVSGKVYEIFYSSSADQFELLNLGQTGGGTVLTNIDMTNGGINNWNNIDVTWQSAWDNYDYVKIIVSDCAVDNLGLVAFALSSNGGISWVELGDSNREAVGWTRNSLNSSNSPFTGSMKMVLGTNSKYPLIDSFGISDNLSPSANLNNSLQGPFFNYNGTTLDYVGDFGGWYGWNTGSPGLNGYMLRFTHEVGDFTSGTLKIIGYNYP
jgi:hypothetical protein